MKIQLNIIKETPEKATKKPTPPKKPKQVTKKRKSIWIELIEDVSIVLILVFLFAFLLY